MKLVLAGADADAETKRAKGPKGRLHVASRGLGLHLCTVQFKGPWLQHTLWCRFSSHYFLLWSLLWSNMHWQYQHDLDQHLPAVIACHTKFDKQKYVESLSPKCVSPVALTKRYLGSCWLVMVKYEMKLRGGRIHEGSEL